MKTETRNIRVLLSYDGTDFLGWQSQAAGRTVQGVVEEALSQVHGHPVSVRVAGRTDSGVHASGQVINFLSDASVPDDRFALACNAHLPPDVRFLQSGRVRDAFDARRDARSRVYRYRISTAQIESPLQRRYVWTIRREPDLRRLNELASVFLGTHDFSTFAAAGDTSATRVRDVFAAVFFPQAGVIVFEIAANAFLYHMVRSIVGTVVELESRGATRDELAAMLCARERDRAGVTAPAWGLELYRVVYDERAFH